MPHALCNTDAYSLCIKASDVSVKKKKTTNRVHFLNNNYFSCQQKGLEKERED